MKKELTNIIVEAENEAFLDCPWCSDSQRIARVVEAILDSGLVRPFKPEYEFYPKDKVPKKAGAYLCITEKGDLRTLWWNPKTETWNRSGLMTDVGFARAFAVDVTAWAYPRVYKLETDVEDEG